MSVSVDPLQVEAMRQNSAAILASALIIASGRPHSVDEAVKLTRDVQFSLAARSGAGVYDVWKRSFDGSEVHK